MWILKQSKKEEFLLKLNVLESITLEYLEDPTTTSFFSILRYIFYIFLHIFIVPEIWVPLIIEEKKLSESEDFISIIHPLSLVPRSNAYQY